MERRRERERERERTEPRVLIIHSDIRRHRATSQQRPNAAGQVNLQDFSFSGPALVVVRESIVAAAAQVHWAHHA